MRLGDREAIAQKSGCMGQVEYTQEVTKGSHGVSPRAGCTRECGCPLQPQIAPVPQFTHLLDYVIVSEKVMYSSKKQSWLEVSKDLRLRAYPLQAMQNSAPSPENSLACLSLSLVASDRTLLWPLTYRTEGD